MKSRSEAGVIKRMETELEKQQGKGMKDAARMVTTNEQQGETNRKEKDRSQKLSRKRLYELHEIPSADQTKFRKKLDLEKHETPHATLGERPAKTLKETSENASPIINDDESSANNDGCDKYESLLRNSWLNDEVINDQLDFLQTKVADFNVFICNSFHMSSGIPANVQARKWYRSQRLVDCTWVSPPSQ
ncbi:hypothetical protein BSL78_22959 [Apostichopus japonicus]|uniref:Uncharacterized protein n=1 Tax=Stichopus japonicus TaxID=307972 RepID=A0A2G8JWZ0_STIJA|nr:hypothetical protein BSL78_22959 [Apostichopus japonicus]